MLSKMNGSLSEMNDKEMQVVVEPLANQESEKEVWRRPDLDTDGRATPKLKMFSDISSKYSTSLSANLLLETICFLQWLPDRS